MILIPLYLTALLSHDSGAQTPFIDTDSAKTLASIFCSRVKAGTSDPIPVPLKSKEANWIPTLKGRVWFCTYTEPEAKEKDIFYQYICLAIGSKDGRYLGMALSPTETAKWQSDILNRYEKSLDATTKRKGGRGKKQ